MQLAEIYFTKNQFGQTVNGNTILNAASADIPGGELEVEAKPTADLTLNASIGYLHARYTQFELNTPATTIAPSGKINLSGYQLQDAPDWTATTGFSYLLPFGPPGETLFTAQYRFTGAKYDYSLENTPRSRVQPTNYLDLTVDWTAPAGDWTVQLWARNITDNHYIASVYDAPGTLGLVNYAPPRMYGATAKFTFGGSPAPAPASPLPPIPAPAPVPSPAPAVAEPARSFQVFFDFDKSDITAAASRVIQAAADAVRAGHVVQITVTGHTDTVGSTAYNQGLSERRASAVKQGLVADGVPNGEITTMGVGKSGLLVPTADGVREPQNRRAEIVLQ